MTNPPPVSPLPPTIPGDAPTTDALTSSGTLAPKVSRRVAIAAGIGHFLEWFDFAVYGFLAATIGTLFFPSGNATTSLWPPSPFSASRSSFVRSGGC